MSARVRWLVALLLFAATFALYARTLAPTLTLRNDGADGGDFVSASVNGSLPHPSGYPTYMLLSKLFLLAPFGDAAYRVNLMSAFAASLAVGLFYLLTTSDETDNWHAHAGALLGVLMLALSPMLWSQATIAEVHTLHLFFIVGTLLLALRWRKYQRARAAWWCMLMLGVGLGNHLTLIFVLPSIALIAARSLTMTPTEVQASGCQPAKSVACAPPWRVLLAACAGLLLGVSVYAYLPLASLLGSHFHWGRVNSFESLATYISADLYHGYLFALPLADLPRRVAALMAMLLSEFQVWGVALAALGAFKMFQRDRKLVVASALLALLSVVFALGYNTADSLRYLTAAWMVVAWWLALGARDALHLLSAWRDGILWQRGVVAALVALTLIPAWQRLPTLDLSQDRSAEQFALDTLNALPPNAVLITVTDRQTFTLWYYAEALRVRADVLIIDRDLLAYPPYRDELRASVSDLRVPDDGQVAALIADNRCTRPFYLLGAQAQPIVLSCVPTSLSVVAFEVDCSTSAVSNQPSAIGLRT